MAQYYFNRSYILNYFIAWVVIFASWILVVIVRGINANNELLVSVGIMASTIWILRYLKYLSAVKNESPALIISEESIYVFELNKTFLWTDIKHYRFIVGLNGNINSISLELFNAKDYFREIKNPVNKYRSLIYYWLFNKKSVIFNARVINYTQSTLKKLFNEYDLKSQSVSLG